MEFLRDARLVPPPPERALDWGAARAGAFARRAVDLVERFVDALPRQPVTRRWPDNDVRNGAVFDVPPSPLPDDAIFDHLARVMLDLSAYPGHPAFMGYISGSGTIPGAVADMLASTLNQNLGGWRLAPAATEIERNLTTWLASKFGLPEGAGGVFTSGGSLGTLTSLKVARDQRAQSDPRFAGVQAGMAIYASEESHAVVVRAADVLGLGRDAVRRIEIDEGGQMKVDALTDAITHDRGKGVHPLAVVATAGTTATGAIDPLPAVADVCARGGLWMHVDAAYGGGAILAPDLAPLFAGVERADSIALDPHKWLYTPIPGGCALFRDMSLPFKSFNVPASYTVEDRERSGSTFDLGSHGLEWSRGFYGFRIWLSLLAYGENAYARRIAHDATLARYMGALVEQAADLELTIPVSLSVCCFRYAPPDARDEQYLDRLNERLMTEVQLDGRAYCSNAIVRGRFSLRACIVNHRTEAEHVERLLAVVRELGTRLHAEMQGHG